LGDLRPGQKPFFLCYDSDIPLQMTTAVVRLVRENLTKKKEKHARRDFTIENSNIYNRHICHGVFFVKLCVLCVYLKDFTLIFFLNRKYIIAKVHTYRLTVQRSVWCRPRISTAPVPATDRTDRRRRTLCLADRWRRSILT
jgi:hypothetical protein